MTALPETCRAIEIKAPGGPEVLVPTTRPMPVPGPGQVLVQVHAAGVNRPDVAQRQGGYPPPPGASDIPGLEIAGEVVAHGPGVTEPALGALVCALVAGGGYANYCLAEAVLCLPFPKGYDALRASALPETFFTVWHNVFQRARLKAGESFLVHGGASGIGTTAIQLAKAFGARAYATAGSPEKCQACLDLGADKAIDYRSEDFSIALQAATQGKGIDVILDMVGGDYIPRNLKLLATDGRLAQIAFLKSPKAEVSFLPIMLKRLTVTGSTLRPQSVAVKSVIAQELRQNVWPLLDAGKVHPVVHASFPLEQAADAHRLMESSKHIGKIVLTV